MVLRHKYALYIRGSKPLQSIPRRMGGLEAPWRKKREEDVKSTPRGMG